MAAPAVARAWSTSAEWQQMQAFLLPGQGRAGWVPVLLLLVLVLGVAVVLLAWRLRCRVMQDRPAAPFGGAVAAMPAQAQGPVVSTVQPPRAAGAEADAQALHIQHAGSPTTAAVPMSVTIAQPPPAVAGGTGQGRSIEEHIDVDQQAQFLVVIGQDEVAIDLLLDHLRVTGGTSPLPYLRLMEIYRKRGDEAAYERTRERFNQRFNAVAPAWQGDEDEANPQRLEAYPETLEEVQRAWASPLDAMAVIESLLFRRGSEAERFDLPAYEELLFLYWLTRELQQAGEDPPDAVDVLLPLDDLAAEVSVIQRSEAVPASLAVDLDLSTVPGPPEGFAAR